MYEAAADRCEFAYFDSAAVRAGSTQKREVADRRDLTGQNQPSPVPNRKCLLRFRGVGTVYSSGGGVGASDVGGVIGVDDDGGAVGVGLRAGAGRGGGGAGVIFARISTSAASSLPISRVTWSRPAASRSTVCRRVAKSRAICCTCAASMGGVAGAVCATAAALLSTTGGFVQPSCWIEFAIICLVSGDQPSSGARVAIICLVVSP